MSKITKEDLKRLEQVRNTEDGLDLAKGVLRLIESMRYIGGIAARGTGREQRDDETTEGFILEYVKSLEAALAEKEEQVGLAKNEAADLRFLGTQMKEQTTALTAENERLKKVPMKYRRMEYNAQLQARVKELEGALERIFNCCNGYGEVARIAADIAKAALKESGDEA